MADTQITQAEADALLELDKHRADEALYSFPGLGGSIAIPLLSADKRETFVLDVWRSQINLVKGKYQNRARGAIVLARLDFGGPPHRNPDDEEIACPHLHLYREGFADKWAVRLPPADFPDASDPWSLVVSFMRFVNIVEPPHLNRDLFT